jgi:hypothetical protein
MNINKPYAFHTVLGARQVVQTLIMATDSNKGRLTDNNKHQCYGSNSMLHARWTTSGPSWICVNIQCRISTDDWYCDAQAPPDAWLFYAASETLDTSAAVSV